MHVRSVALLLILATFLLGAHSTAANAYVGPGAGLSAIGSLVSVVSALLLAIAGFVWYPLKRLLRRGRRRPVPTTTSNQSAAEGE